jgi:hypothetical protein
MCDKMADDPIHIEHLEISARGTIRDIRFRVG